eukprot:NODE_157_length_16664_cov_0.301781.p10 type:complete len:162 gc:universal NODE_157_length_16664_cov_0.301781:8172-7687(-)
MRINSKVVCLISNFQVGKAIQWSIFKIQRPTQCNNVQKPAHCNIFQMQRLPQFSSFQILNLLHFNKFPIQTQIKPGRHQQVCASMLFQIISSLICLLAKSVQSRMLIQLSVMSADHPMYLAVFILLMCNRFLNSHKLHLILSCRAVTISLLMKPCKCTEAS